MDHRVLEVRFNNYLVSDISVGQSGELFKVVVGVGITAALEVAKVDECLDCLNSYVAKPLVSTSNYQLSLIICSTGRS